jgi:hypothetical protein
MDTVENYDLLKSRLEREENRTALLDLIVIYNSAVNEMHKYSSNFTLSGDSSPIAVRLPSMSAYGKRELLFTIGSSCILDVKMDSILQTTLEMCNISYFPNCAMLYLIAMAENLDGSVNTMMPGSMFLYELMLSENGCHETELFENTVKKLEEFYDFIM